MRSVPIDVYRDKIKQDQSLEWGFGIWDYPPLNKGEQLRKSWGLTLFNEPTQMCYLYENPYVFRNLISERERRYNLSGDDEWFKWYFHVGNKIWCYTDDIVSAAYKLGIW